MPIHAPCHACCGPFIAMKDDELRRVCVSCWVVKKPDGGVTRRKKKRKKKRNKKEEEKKKKGGDARAIHPLGNHPLRAEIVALRSKQRNPTRSFSRERDEQSRPRPKHCLLPPPLPPKKPPPSFAIRQLSSFPLALSPTLPSKPVSLEKDRFIIGSLLLGDNVFCTGKITVWTERDGGSFTFSLFAPIRIVMMSGLDLFDIYRMITGTAPMSPSPPSHIISSSTREPKERETRNRTAPPLISNFASIYVTRTKKKKKISSRKIY